MDGISAVRGGPLDSTRSPYARLHTLPLTSVTLGPGFWADKQAINRAASLEHGYQMLEKAGNLHNFRVAAGRETGDYRGRNFMDENVYKWLEAVAYELAKTPDSPLRATADAVIDLIGEAQQPDGYLNTYYTFAEPQNRWADLDHGHELYCGGHLFQAAVAYHRATGDDQLLGIATRFADHMDSVFGPDKRHGTCGHPEIELALMELYRETREPRYLALGKFFVDQRGKGTMRGLGWYGPEYHQDRVPVRQASVIEGHAVRAMYLMAGVTDLYLETGEQALYDALERLWHDMTSGKLHLTGGAGARYEGESFGDPYELPNDQCYCETCAAIGSVMWNWRMLLATGEARFADLMEQTLYNGVLSGPALDGTHFFYINPLLSRGGYQRAEWYAVACCPPNIMRTVGSIEHFLATQDARGIQLHLYAAATLRVQNAQGPTTVLHIDTRFPWEGQIAITVEQTPGIPWALSLRIPGWASNATLTVNGQPAGVAVNPGSYAAIERTWQPGDVVVLDLPVAPRLYEAHPLIDATRHSVAILVGPLVYCLEQVDQAPAVDVLRVQIDESAPLEAHWQADLLGGTVIVSAAGYQIDPACWQNRLYRPLGSGPAPAYQPVRLKAVPYHLWGNRGPNAMRVWIPRSE